MTGHIKAAVVSTIAILPVFAWGLASALVRAVWPGFRRG